MPDLPVPEPAEPVEDAERLSAIARLRDLVATGELSLERFSASLDQVLAAKDQADLEDSMAALPSIVRLTPASRRLTQPLEIDAGIRALDLGAGWQLGAETTVSSATGRVRLDLTAASWDARRIDLRLQSATGSITVVVPEGVALQMVSAKGRVTLKDLTPPVPGAPVLRIEAATGTGRIQIEHPPAPRRRRWWRRRRAGEPSRGRG